MQYLCVYTYLHIFKLENEQLKLSKNHHEIFLFKITNDKWKNNENLTHTHTDDIKNDEWDERMAVNVNNGDGLMSYAEIHLLSPNTWNRKDLVNINIKTH